MLDAYALIALLADEPAADEVGQLIRENTTAIPAPNLAEATDRLGRVHGIAIERTSSAVESLQESTDLRVLPLDGRDAWRAAGLRVAHYHRTRRPLSLADCLLLAVTGEQDQLATSDPYVLATATEEHVGWIDLPDSRGDRHAPG